MKPWRNSAKAVSDELCSWCVTVPIALKREGPHEIKGDDNGTIKMNAEPDVMLESLMWLDLIEIVAQGHNASNEEGNPLDDKIDVVLSNKGTPEIGK